MSAKVGLALASSRGGRRRALGKGPPRRTIPPGRSGKRLDPAVIRERFATAWQRARPIPGRGRGRGLDLARTMRTARSCPKPATTHPRQALREADALLADLLAEVDPERDAVLLVAPYQPAR